MDILSYLTELLKSRKEVGIVGLGTIYKKKSPGRYDAETHSFLPPGHKLEFTEELEERTALAEFISKKKNISFDSSSYYIEQFVEELQKQLRESGRADLGELGSFTTDEDGIFFNPQASADFGFDFYGLPSVKDEIPVQETDHTAGDSEEEAGTIVKETAPAEPQEIYEEHIAAENEQRNDLDEYTEELPVVTEEQIEVTEEQLDLEDNNADLSDGQTEPDDQPVYDEISELKHEQHIPQSTFIETPEGQQEETEPYYMNPAPVHQTGLPDTPVPKTGADPYWNFDKAHQLGSAQFYDSPDKTEKEERNMPVYLKVIVAGIVLLTIIATLYFIRPDLFNNTDIKSPVRVPAEQKEILKTDSVIMADTTGKPTDVINSAQDSLKKQSTVTTPVAQADTITTWEVIGASVINQKEVDQVLAEFKKGGINAKVIPGMPGKRRIKISIATFYDETSAREGRKELALKLKNPDLYIYQNKHKQTHK